MGVSGASMSMRGVVHAQRPECRDDMFDRADAVAVLLDGRAARSVGHVVAQRRNHGAAFDVGAAEYDARVGRSRIYRHGYPDARVQSLAGERHGVFDGLLFHWHKQGFKIIFARKDNEFSMKNRNFARNENDRFRERSPAGAAPAAAPAVRRSGPPIPASGHTTTVRGSARCSRPASRWPWRSWRGTS